MLVHLSCGFIGTDPKKHIKPGLLSTSIDDAVKLSLGRVYGEVVVGYLVSYVEQMGWAEARCVMGCKCAKVVLEGRHWQRNSVLT